MNNRALFSLSKPMLTLLFLPFATNTIAAVDGESKNDPINPGISWSASAGAGFDNNVFRTPSSDYIDYAITPTPTLPTTTNIQSGVYTPLNLEAEYVKKHSKNNYLSANYKFDGRFYLDSDLTNANIFKHTISLGDTYISARKGKRENTLYSAIVFAHRKALYLDRDTGEHQDYQNADISERYIYDMAGVELKYKNRISKLKYNLQSKYNQKTYVVAAGETPYDHTYYQIGGDVKYRLPTKHTLTLSYKYWVYDYDQRKSRTPDGSLSGPPRKYVYNRIGLTVRKRLSKTWLAYIDYEWTNRTDKSVGYDDYTKNLLKTRIHYKWNENNRLKISLSVWERSYPNAFAFDDTNQESKYYDGIGVSINSSTQLSKSESIVAEVKYTDDNSTDDRYQYDRLETSISYQWEYK